MKKAYRFLFALCLPALAVSCDTESFVQDPGGDAFVRFSASEDVPDFLTKSGAALSEPEEEIVLTSRSGDTLVLSVTQELIPFGALRRDDAPATKAGKVYRSSDAIALQGDPFAVWCYRLDGALRRTLDLRTQSHRKVKYDAAGKKFWRPVKADESFDDIEFQTNSGYTSRWYALAPWSAVNPESGNTVTLPTASAENPTLEYTVPAAVDKQVDLMAARSIAREEEKEDANVHPPIAMKFYHMLTAVRFRKDSDVGVTSIEVKGVYDKGTLYPEKVPQSPQALPQSAEDAAADPGMSVFTEANVADLWTVDENQKADYVMNMSDGNWIGGASDPKVADDAHILMLMPQWLPKDAEIVAKVDGKDYTGPIAGHRWLPGRMVTYRIKKAKLPDTYEFVIENELGDLSDVSSGNGVNVKLYVTPAGGSAADRRQLDQYAWEVDGIYKTKTAAAAGDHTQFMPAGWRVKQDGNGLAVTAPDKAAYQNMTSEQLIKQGVGTDGSGSRGSDTKAWNLSNPSGADLIAESANTYIINDPGTYRIPLVAGNGVVNGTPNANAYSPSNFRDYKGKAIVSPYLHKTSTEAGTPTSATVLWSEIAALTQADMAPSVTATGDGADKVYWLEFKIPQDKIAPGCVALAVKDGTGLVMWSWTLWITDYEPGAGDVRCTYNRSFAGIPVVVTEGEGQATFMPRNLGWTVSGNLSGGREKTWAYVRLRVVDAPDNVCVVAVRRPSSPATKLPYEGHGPYYQWGRKDALIPGKYSVVSSTAAVGLETLIQNPASFFKHDAVAGSLRGSGSYFLWNQAGTAEDDPAPVKTIYDPCPAGYRVSRPREFSGFGSATVTAESRIHIASCSQVSSFKGLSFYNHYKGESSASGSLFFPASGRINYNSGDVQQGVAGSNGVGGACWTNVSNVSDAAAETYNFGWRLIFEMRPSGTATTMVYENGRTLLQKGAGYPVRPVQNK